MAYEGGSGPGAIAGPVYMASTSYRQYIWLMMMDKAFENADVQRRALVTEGPWTARTDSIVRFSRFETYA